MGRPLRLLAGLALGAALAIATSAAAIAAQPTPPTIEDQHDRRLRQLEAEQAARTQAAVELFRSGERNVVPAADSSGDVAAPPSARPAPVPAPIVPRPAVGVVASLLLGLVGGVVGGCAVLAGWAAATRRRLRQPASAT
jgi:soluble lytic murein transglycosylase-like protein